MKRDLGLIRLILLEAEKAENTAELEEHYSRKYGEGYADVKAKHVALMKEAGLVEAGVNNAGNSRVVARVNSITWSGYEYLDSVRDPEVWIKTKTAVERFGSASLDVVKQVAADVIKKLIVGS